MTLPRRRIALAISLLAAAGALVAGCGGSGSGTGSRDRAAPPASDFPAAEGKTLREVLSASTGQGPVVSPAQRVLREGENRFGFGVFNLDRTPVEDAQVAIYAAPGVGLKGPATGPFPARIEDITTETAFRAKTTAADPNAPKVVYVTDLPLDRPGAWTFGALVKNGSSYEGSLLATPSKVGQFKTPGPGDKAPVVHTRTQSDVSSISQIDTRVPPDDMHSEDFADVVGKKPVVLQFATPAFCESRVCGPVVDVAEQVKRDFGDRVAFIHQEVYKNNRVSDGVVPQMEAYGLPSEPWVFVIDRNGKVSSAIEGAFGPSELEAAVRKVAG